MHTQQPTASRRKPYPSAQHSKLSTQPRLSWDHASQVPDSSHKGTLTFPHHFLYSPAPTTLTQAWDSPSPPRAKNLTPTSRSKIQKPSDLKSPGESLPFSGSQAPGSSFHERTQCLLYSVPIIPSPSFFSSLKTVTVSSWEGERG